MNSTSNTASLTRQQLLLAALRLFAENGIHAVSLRSINQAAGARNSGAVHYHFENKTGLLLALVDDLMDRIAAYRGNSLRELAERSEPASVRECLDIFYRPNWLLHFDPEVGGVSTKFLLLHQMTPVPEVQQRLAERASVNWHLLEELLLRAMPNKDRGMLRIHIGMSWVGVLNGLAALDLMGVTPFGDMRTGSMEQMLPAFQQYLAAGVSS
jgi:AcrR family transcriptional regulator